MSEDAATYINLNKWLKKNILTLTSKSSFKSLRCHKRILMMGLTVMVLTVTMALLSKFSFLMRVKEIHIMGKSVVVDI